MDWEVRVVTPSNYIQNVRVNDCITREDAEAAARGMTGSREVLNSNPKTYNDKPEVVYEVVENDSYTSYEVESNYSDYDSTSLDKMEEEMYDLMCQIAMEEGEELPTIQEFYDYLNSDD
jgi:hypothetical protein